MGKDFFDDLATLISSNYNSIVNNDEKSKKDIDNVLLNLTKNKSRSEILLIIYDYYYHTYQSDLGHFFRNLYYIIRYIDNSNIRKSDKIEFTKILRSQLSNYELLILAYNGLHYYGKEFKPLIEKYELLKSLNNELNLPSNYIKRIVDLDLLINEYPHLNKYWKMKN